MIRTVPNYIQRSCIKNKHKSHSSITFQSTEGDLCKFLDGLFVINVMSLYNST